MNTFSCAYNNSRDEIKAEKKMLVEQQHAEIVTAMKNRFGIDDFSKLDEAEKASYRTMLHEMWDKEEGLTKAGIAFINEGTYKLNKDATPEQIEKKFKSMINDTVLNNCCTALSGSGTSFEGVSNIRKELEAQIGKKISNADAKRWFAEKFMDFIKRKINRIKI
jgi:Icc-related predicted phosphoesterase